MRGTALDESQRSADRGLGPKTSLSVAAGPGGGDVLIVRWARRSPGIGAWMLRKGQRELEHWAAAVYRRALRRVLFIGVTGSVGKTITKELIAAILGAQGRGRKNIESKNGPHWVARTILATRPTDSFCVVEVGATGIGTLDRPARLLRPQVAVITLVASDHRSSFQTLAATAVEKGKLVAALPEDGIAILNADDPHVRAMGTRCPGRVVTYGLASDAGVRADQIRAAWPDRLAFRVHYAGQSLPVETQLCGTHWVPSVLAALATGVALGVPLARGVAAVRTVEPVTGRLSPVTDAHGVTFLRDDWKASVGTMPAAFQFLAEAYAPRKIAVIGTVSDYSGDATRQYVKIAQDALDVAHHVVLVGSSAARGLRARRHRPNAPLCAFGTVRQASDYLEGLLRPGDLVLLKGSTTDHLERIALRRTQSVACWLTGCGRKGACERCALVQLAGGVAAPPVSFSDGPEEVELETAHRLIVGFGNPGERYRHTPHNVGQQVLDELAARLGVRWASTDDAVVARVTIGTVTAYLVKPLTKVNLTGGVVKQFADRVGLGPSECILVHDDVDLPLGALRTRLGGGAGGHNGVRSVIEAYQSQTIPRVKIGVGRPPRKEDVPAYVITPLPADRRAVLDRACHEAVTRLLGLVDTATAAGVASSAGHGRSGPARERQTPCASASPEVLARP